MARGFTRWFVTLVLCIFLGPLGVHRFVTGSILYGMVFLILSCFAGSVHTGLATFIPNNTIVKFIAGGGLLFFLWAFDIFQLLTGTFKYGRGARIVR